MLAGLEGVLHTPTPEEVVEQPTGQVLTNAPQLSTKLPVEEQIEPLPTVQRLLIRHWPAGHVLHAVGLVAPFGQVFGTHTLLAFKYWPAGQISHAGGFIAPLVHVDGVVHVGGLVSPFIHAPPLFVVHVG